MPAVQSFAHCENLTMMALDSVCHWRLVLNGRKSPSGAQFLSSQRPGVGGDPDMAPGLGFGASSPPATSKLCKPPPPGGAKRLVLDWGPGARLQEEGQGGRPESSRWTYAAAGLRLKQTSPFSLDWGGD